MRSKSQENGFQSIVGVDFSGAKLAGRNIWIAQTAHGSRGRLILDRLDSLETLAGSAERAPALAHLVDMILRSERALWAIDFPFGLPVEVIDGGARSRWRDQLAMIRNWADGAYELGLHCVQRARRLGNKLHIRRTTDTEVATPFDCYHYRIIYQTYHGIADVLAPLARKRGHRTAILPFDYRSLESARRVVVEACPSSTLKRLRLPHQNYKQPAGGPLTARRRRTRIQILDGLGDAIEITGPHRRAIMRNPGGDALDAVIAAVGAWQAWANVDHGAIARHARYPREGFVYA